jgi:hypothetical protein
MLNIAVRAARRAGSISSPAGSVQVSSLAASTSKSIGQSSVFAANDHSTGNRSLCVSVS